MSWNWQDISALSIVGGATMYVTALVYRRLRRRETGACDSGCSGCEQTELASTQQVPNGLVPLEHKVRELEANETKSQDPNGLVPFGE